MCTPKFFLPYTYRKLAISSPYWLREFLFFSDLYNLRYTVGGITDVECFFCKNHILSVNLVQKSRSFSAFSKSMSCQWLFEKITGSGCFYWKSTCTCTRWLFKKSLRVSALLQKSLALSDFYFNSCINTRWQVRGMIDLPSWPGFVTAFIQQLVAILQRKWHVYVPCKKDRKC